MLRGLWKLTWLEIKIFLREPLGAIGTSRSCPIVLFVVLGRHRRRPHAVAHAARPTFIALRICRSSSSILISLERGAVAGRRSSRSTARAASSSGCARRRCGRTRSSRAQVLVKLSLTLVTIVADDGGGPACTTRSQLNVPVASFALALLFSTLSILAIGFRDREPRSPTARFAQPVGALIFYPMIYPLSASTLDPCQGRSRLDAD